MKSRRLALFSTWTLLSNVAWASPPEKELAVARECGERGAKQFEQGEYPEAIRSFQCSYDIAPVPRIAVRLARTYVARGDLVKAVELYEAALALTPNELWKGNLQQKAQAEAKEELEKLRPRLAHLTIHPAVPTEGEARLLLDGEPLDMATVGVARAANPGHHVIAADVDNLRDEHSFDLADGETKIITLELKRDVPPAISAPPKMAVSPLVVTAPIVRRSEPSWWTANRRALGWVSTVVGGAALTAGAASGLYVLLERHAFNECSSPNCPSWSESRRDRYEALRWVSSGTLIGGAVLAGAGVTVLLLTPPEGGSSSNTVSLSVSPQAVRFQAHF